jgi:hypothetical protein
VSEPFLEALRAQRLYVERKFIEQHPIVGPHALKWIEDFPPTEPGHDWHSREAYVAGYNQCLQDLKMAIKRERETNG